MKSSARLMVVMALAVAFVLVPEVRSQPAGEALAAPPPADFTLGSTNAEVTHETANQCLSPGKFVSCQAPFFDSDSYAVNASVDASSAVDLDTDVTHILRSIHLRATFHASISEFLSSTIST